MNRESTWEECIESSSSVSITPDKAKAKSAIDECKLLIKEISIITST